jgi:predicted nucleic acid-binding protein
VNERWVLNASPLIGLGRIDQTDLLLQLAEAIVIPRAVADEILAGPADDGARRALAKLESGIVHAAASPEILAWDLGAGETDVLSYALANDGWTAVIDDAIARKCARSFSLRTKGTLSIVISAKQRDLIPSAADVLRQLLRAGFHLADETIREALRRTVGESW